MKPLSYRKYTLLGLLLFVTSTIIAAVLTHRNNTAPELQDGRLEYSTDGGAQNRNITCRPGGFECSASVGFTNTSITGMITSYHAGTSLFFEIQTTS